MKYQSKKNLVNKVELIKSEQKLKQFFNNFFVIKKSLIKISQPLIKINFRDNYTKILERIYFSNLYNQQQMQLIDNHDIYLNQFWNQWNQKFNHGLFSFNYVINKNANLSEDVIINQSFILKFHCSEIKYPIDDLFGFINDLWSAFIQFWNAKNDHIEDWWLDFHDKYLNRYKFVAKNSLTKQQYQINWKSLNREQQILIVKDLLIWDQETFLEAKQKKPENSYTIFLNQYNKKPLHLISGYWTSFAQNESQQYLTVMIHFEAFLAIYLQLKKIIDLNLLYLET
ncbi:hypothetical protein MCAV_04460 [[Mycoplasma] cavipharyngis]|uniref:hypothetical protein n=1 Tax=[Mycoplasma] cavipharyngis TaxID=92757 RepID=UPI0037044764